MNLIMIAKGNLRKKKSEMAVVFLLVAMTFLLFYFSTAVLVNLDAVQERTHAQTNGADLILASTSPYREEILALLREQPEVEQAFAEEILWMTDSRYYRPGQEEDKAEMYFLIAGLDWKSELGRPVIQEDEAAGEATMKGEAAAGGAAMKGEAAAGEAAMKENSIVLPYYLKANEGYAVGDRICLDYNGHTYTFEVYGFAEDIFFSTPANFPAIKCFVTADWLAELKEENQKAAANLYLYNLKDSSQIGEFAKKISPLLETEIPGWQQGAQISLDKDSMKIGGAMYTNILMAVTMVFSMMLLAVALAVIRFSIRNSIELNLKNIGLQQALGYTVRQLGLITVAEIMGVTLMGLLVGLVFAGQAAEALGNMISSANGIRWNQGFDSGCALAGGIIISLLILVGVLAEVRHYGKITPLDALREGIRTHSFKKNSFPLGSSRLPLQASLGFKHIFRDRKTSLAIIFIVALLTLAGNIGLIVYQNLVVNQDTLNRLTGLEVPELTLTMDGVDEAAIDEIVRVLSGQKETADILRFNSAGVTISYKDRELRQLCEFYDNPAKLRSDKVIEGHRPEAANEIMLSSLLCRELAVQLGDMVYLEHDGKREAFLLAGICQQMSNLGRSAMASTEGGERLYSQISTAELYCYAKAGVSYEEISEAYQALYPEIKQRDMKSVLGGSMQSISGAMTAVCGLFLMITMMVVFLVIFLLTRSRLIRERRQNGIYKAVGYTTGQLLRQTVMGYVPVVFAGASAGAAAALFLVNPLMLGVFSVWGFRSVIMEIIPGDLILFTLGITVLAGLVAVLCALRLRKLDPCRMLRENI